MSVFEKRGPAILNEGSDVEVGVIMGSESDLPIMRAAPAILEELGVRVEVAIKSAHRTPDAMSAYARAAAGLGLKVIIAGAGGSAHLPGMVAAYTELPVIGVPVESKNPDSKSSLWSIIDMPEGVPVATVGTNRAKNAGLLAARILAINDPALRENLRTYIQAQTERSLESNNKLQETGYKDYGLFS